MKKCKKEQQKWINQHEAGVMKVNRKKDAEDEENRLKYENNKSDIIK